MGNISRRGFVKGAACGAAASAASMAGVVFASEAEMSWDAEYDVVIAGYGATGAVAAIEAADNGARVLLVEKAPEGGEGGCSKVNEQLITCTDNAEDYYTYWDFLRGGFMYPDDDLLRLYTDSAANNWAYLQYLGAAEEDLDFHSRGADIATGPKAECVYVTKVVSSYYQLLQANVEKRADNIEVWFEAPAVDLVQDPISKEVLGLVVEKGGELLNVRGIGGVVLATGGFENNQRMVEAFMSCNGTTYRASKYCTGDGVRMCMAVGSDLVNMSMGNAFSWGIATEEGNGVGYTNAVRDMGITVTGDGVRFYNERQSARRSNLNYFGNWRVPIFPDEAWFVCDASALAAGPLFTGYSDDNAAEVAAGAVVQGETIEELAEKCGMDPETLAATVATFNEAAVEDNDPFGRPADRIVPIEQAPFCAVKMIKIITNTEGGPRRDAWSRVLDTYGNPIPGLFAGGCLGCPNIGEDWNCGGNMSESIVFGRIIGAKTAAIAAGGDADAAQPVEIPAHTYNIPKPE